MVALLTVLEVGEFGALLVSLFVLLSLLPGEKLLALLALVHLKIVRLLRHGLLLPLV